ncbi:hypothetical protein TrLO_g1039 [Triparma laevis f. longispina]|uniref:Uncharacterized protein n=2 Tax=Triparma laevis TaxID=1534972 RepID=A0A9W7A799_9STRA|nr:hypothetical protein TrLO_g1039 [Triparma laevis f. longispina]
MTHRSSLFAFTFAALLCLSSVNPWTLRVPIARRPTTSLSARRGKLSKELQDITSSSSSSSKANSVTPSSSSTRREKSAERQRQSSEVFKKEKLIIAEILELVESPKRDLPSIFSSINSLKNLPSQSLRVITSSSTLKDYTVAFAQNDDAVSHIGTGLHKVPLARLDAMYLTLGKNLLTIREVIRIIGPFPNILNTISGKTSTTDDALKLTIESVIDGTGKELVGEEDRIVDLKVMYASEQIIVFDTGEEKGGKEGQRVLIFVKEDDIDGQLYERNLGEDKKNKI